MRKEKEAEFLQLRQGNMTVTEYEQRFHELSQFATRIIADERDRIDRFVGGLDPELRGPVISVKAMGRPMQEIMEAAHGAEKTYHELQDSRRSTLISRGNTSHDSRIGKPKVVDKGQAHMSSKWTGRKRHPQEVTGNLSRVIPSHEVPKFLPCPICKISHAGRCSVGEGRCYLCSSRKHGWRKCYKLPLACPLCGLTGHKRETCRRLGEVQGRAQSQVVSSTPHRHNNSVRAPAGQNLTRTQASNIRGHDEPARVYQINPREMSTAGNVVTGMT